jgi:TonB-linked SusC/RagA family outer membrane protein
MYLKFSKQIIMRFTLIVTLFSVAVSMVTAEETMSQSKKETGIALSLTNESVVSVIEAISKETGYEFLYNKTYLSQLGKITVKVRRATIQQVLQQVANQTGLEFHRVGETYVVAASTESAKVEAKVQQGSRVTGTVVDQDGFPLPGVTIAVKERPGVGASTDVEGRYSIDCSANETLLFSFLGFQTIERAAGEINRVAITLREDVQSIEELVIVAFGKQKKESVVSSIGTVTPSDLKVPSSNLTTAFAGRMSGIIAYQRSGEPGLDNAEFFIRGITSFSAGGKKDPLILIDGVEMNTFDLARINPDDISSFSVLKDANAAALYGARGANGVILVTTKEGVAEKLSINVRAEFSTSANSELVQLADPITFMQLHNEAVNTRRPDVRKPHTLGKIYYTEQGKYPLKYPSVDWYDYLIKDRTFNQRVNANISGGGKAVQYYVAANYQHDTGIIKESEENRFNNNINIHRIQLRSNVTIKLTPQTTGMVRFYGTFDDSQGPRQGGEQVFHMARNATPVRFLPYYPKDEKNEFTKHILFGMAESEGRYVNPLAQIVSGYKESKRTMMFTQMEVDHRFDGALKGLFARGTVNIKRDSWYDLTRAYSPFYYTPETTLDGTYSLFCFNPLDGTEFLNYGFGGKNRTGVAFRAM